MTSNKTPQAFGIDLGTSYTLAATWTAENNRAAVIRDDQGNRKIPSVVSFTGPRRLIGEAAESELWSNPENTLRDTKRLLGSTDENMDALCQFDGSNFRVSYGGKKQFFRPDEINAMLIAEAVNPSSTGDMVIHAVIAVPANFNTVQRGATKRAGEAAGLRVLGLINESTAAAIAYGYGKKKGSRNVLVVNIGGGNLDVSVIAVQNNHFDVLATVGDSHLGGNFFTEAMVKKLVKDFDEDHPTKLDADQIYERKKQIVYLTMECEEAKKMFTTGPSDKPHRICVPRFRDEYDLNAEMTMDEFEDINDSLFEAISNKIAKTIEESGLKIHDAVLVGGASRMPRIQHDLEKLIGRDKIRRGVDRDEAVVEGATIYAALLNGNNIKEKLFIGEVSTHEVRVNNDRNCVVSKQSRIPTRRLIKADNIWICEDKICVLKHRPDHTTTLYCEINADGMCEIRPAQPKYTKMAERLQMIDMQDKVTKQFLDDLNQLHSFAAAVKPIIGPNSSGQKSDSSSWRHDSQKCNKITAWAEHILDQKNPKITKRKMNKHQRTLKKLEKRYDGSPPQTSGRMTQL